MLRVFLILLLAVSCGVEPDVEVTESALTTLNVPGRYRSDAVSSKSRGSVFWGQQYNNANLTTAATTVNGTPAISVSRTRTPFGDFPSPCSFKMIAYPSNFSSPPVSSPPGAFAGPQTQWSNSVGTCTCVNLGTSTIIPAGVIRWHQTNSGTGYLIEKMAFGACGFTWTSSGALYPN